MPRPEEDEERLRAGMDLTQTLREGGELDEALQLDTETLSIARRVFGDEHERTPVAMGELAAVHSVME